MWDECERATTGTFVQTLTSGNGQELAKGGAGLLLQLKKERRIHDCRHKSGEASGNRLGGWKQGN